MLRVPSRLVRRLCCAAALLACATTVACGAPPELSRVEGSPTPAVATPTTPASPIPTVPPTGLPVAPTPTASGFPETLAVSCAGRPSGAQIIRLVRRGAGVLPTGVRVSVDVGPLCAGTWQYTVLAVAGHEPLAVVTRGRPGGLRVVTAGTNVCTIPVRTEAPIGIRTAAACS